MQTIASVLIDLKDCKLETIRYVRKDQCIEYTYSELYQAAVNVSCSLEKNLIARGDRVGVINTSFEGVVLSFWALTLSGCVPVLLSPVVDYSEHDPGVNKLNYAIDCLDIRTIIGDVDAERLSSGVPNEQVSICDFQTLRQYAKTPGDLNRCLINCNPNDTALIMLTSGSTGAPKAVPLSHRNLLAALSAKRKHYKLSKSDLSLNFLPLDHVAGIIEFHLLQCFSRCSQVHVDKASILSDPNNYLILLAQYSATMSMAPNFFLEQINKSLKSDLNINLSSLRILVCGGDFVCYETVQTFTQQLNAHYALPLHCVQPAFGMTETCAGITYSTLWQSGKDDKFLSLGKAIQHAKIRITDTVGKPVPDGTVGELEVKGPMVFNGYMDAQYNSGLMNNGWMKTGDMGFIRAGELYLTGRFKHVFVVNGMNHACQEVEQRIRGQIPSLRDDSIVITAVDIPGVFSEQFIVAYASDRTKIGQKDYALSMKIRTICLKYVGAVPYAVFPIKDAYGLRSTIGKFDRSKLRSDFESGVFTTLLQEVIEFEQSQRRYVPAETQIEKELVRLVSRMVGSDVTQTSLTDRFLDLGATSLISIQFQQGILDTFGVDLPITDIIQNPTLQGIAAEIERQQSPKYHATPKPYDPLVKLNTSGNEWPVFCVHPGVGDVLVFIELAKKFHGERPFYALRARGFNEGETYFSTLDEIVDSYIVAMKRVQPKPPYFIAGYSYGACIAYAISHRLQQQGDAVAFTGIINLPPYIKERMDQLNLLEGLLHLCMFVGLYQKHELNALREAIKNLSFEEQVVYLLKGDADLKQRVSDLNLDATKLANWTQLAQSLIEIGKTFLPYSENKIDRVHIFHAIALFDSKAQWLRKLKDWERYTREENGYYEVPGEHYTMMSPEHVNGFYDIFNGVLQQCSLSYLAKQQIVEVAR